MTGGDGAGERDGTGAGERKGTGTGERERTGDARGRGDILREELARLLDAAGGVPDGSDALDVLWIARLSGLDPVGAERFANGGQPTATSSSETPQPPVLPDDHPARHSGRRPPQARLHLPAATPGTAPMRPGDAHAVRVAQPRALPDTLGLARALRPLRQTVPATRARTLDVAATAAASGDTGLLLPVLRPATERRFSVDLLIDTGTTMTVWYRLADELRTLLSRHGAFADVRAWALHTDGPEPTLARFRRGAQAPTPTRRWQQALVDPTGRRAVLVLTDGVGPSWYGDELPATLADWSRRRPVAALQVLPSRLWHRTALRTAPVRARGTEAARATIEVRSTGPLPGIPRGRAGIDARTRIRWLPVLEVSGDWLTPWARLLSGSTTDWTPLEAVALTEADRPSPPVEAGAPGGPADPPALIERFEEGYSPEAFRLLRLLAAAPLSLPVMRLVQRTMLPSSTPMHLAEIFLSGLLVRSTPARPGEDPDQVAYDFRPGVREALLGRLTRTESLRVLRQVWDGVSERVGRTFGGVTDFAAWAAVAANGGLDGLELPPESRAFAEVAVTVFKGIGGDYAEMVARQAGAWASAVPADPVPADLVSGDPMPGDPMPADPLPDVGGKRRREWLPRLFSRSRSRPREQPLDVGRQMEKERRRPLRAEVPLTKEDVRGGARVSHQVPPLPMPYVHRDESEDVLRVVRAGRPGAFTLRRSATCVIEGAQGVGKSTLAGYCARKEEKGFTMVRWIRAHDRRTMLEDLARLAHELGVSRVLAGPFPASLLSNLHDHLRANPGWLLVYDGVTTEALTPYPDEPADARTWCLPPEGYGSVLVTLAEGASWPETRHKRVTLGDFSRDQAGMYLRQALAMYRGELWDRITELTDLVEIEGTNPRALAQLVSTLTTRRVPVFHHVQEELATRRGMDRCLTSLVWITQDDEFVGTGIAVGPDAVLTSGIDPEAGVVRCHQLSGESMSVVRATSAEMRPGLTLMQLKEPAFSSMPTAGTGTGTDTDTDSAAVVAAWHTHPNRGASWPGVHFVPASSEAHLPPPGAVLIDVEGRLHGMVARVAEGGTVRVPLNSELVDVWARMLRLLKDQDQDQDQERKRKPRATRTGARRHERLIYLSYARTSTPDKGHGSPERRFFADLAQHLAQVMPFDEESIGFVEQDVAVGETGWDRMEEDLKGSTVFVPLYSPQYLESSLTPRVWEVISWRWLIHGRRGTPVAVPVVWTPVDPGQLPREIQNLPYRFEEFGGRYAEEGLLGLWESGSYREYHQVVRRIATMIVEAVQASDP